MKKISLLVLCAICIGLSAPAQAEYTDPNTYAQDKLLNAEAQLAKLNEQKKALNKLIKAVKKDLKAAKTRAKAEKLQSKADGVRSDASTLVEQSGLAVDLPDFMISSGVNAELARNKPLNPEQSDLMFRDGSQTETSSVFFPGSDGIESDVVLPPNVREIK